MRTIKSGLLCIAMASAMLQATAWAIVPVTVLGEDADVVVLGTIVEMKLGITAGVTVQLQPVAILKGQMSLSPASAELAPSPLMKDHAARQVPSAADVAGLFFLKRDAEDGYKLIPTELGNYTESAAFIPLPAWWIPPASASFEEILLSAALASYQSIESPSRLDEGKLLVSLENASRGEALAVADQLMDSPSADQKALGFAAAIQLGSDDAVVRLAAEAVALRLSRNFSHITGALENYYQPLGPQSLEGLRQLVLLRSDAPRLDLAVTAALGRVGSQPHTPPAGPGPAVPAAPGVSRKQALPILVDLLDSRDPQAQLRAAWLLGQFAVLANENGEIVQGVSSPHPFRSDDAIRYMPRKDSTISVAEYVSFWKSWWAQNRAKLGFAAAP
jgi:hypothetical protein